MPLSIKCPDGGNCGRKNHFVVNDAQLAKCRARAASASQRAKGGSRLYQAASGGAPPPAVSPLDREFHFDSNERFWTPASEDLEFRTTSHYDGVLTTDADDGQPMMSVHSETVDAAVKSVEVTDFYGRTRRGLSVRMDPKDGYDLSVELYIDPDVEDPTEQVWVRSANSPDPRLRSGVPVEQFGEMSEAEILGTGRSDTVHPVAAMISEAATSWEGSYFVRRYADRRPTYAPLSAGDDGQISFADLHREDGKTAEDSEWLNLEQVKATWTAEHHSAVHKALGDLEQAGGQFYLGDTVPVRDGQDVVLVEVLSITDDGSFSGPVVGGSPSSTFGYYAENHPEDDVVRDEFALPNAYLQTRPEGASKALGG